MDVISFRIENVNAEGLDLLASLKPVRPAPSVLRISQDRVTENSFERRRRGDRAVGPVAAGGVGAAAAALGLPAVLKTTRLGYDGKGQRTLRDQRSSRMLSPRWSRSR